MIERLIVQNFKIFGAKFALSLNKDLNILVGDNESGKSTILEAITLALTKKIGGRPIEYEITSHIFNQQCVRTYVADCRAGKNPALPVLFVELYLADIEEVQSLCGTNNSRKEDCPGVRLEITFDEDYRVEYATLLEDSSQIRTVPAEYYRAHWQSFAGQELTSRSLKILSSYIDATTIRLQSGADSYLQNIISGSLDSKEKVALSVAYRKLKEQFSDEPAIARINAKLTANQGAISKKALAMTIDTSQRSNWETNLIPHLDDLPFPLIGKGEQSTIKTLLALHNKGGESQVILIEEPENHLSFSNMHRLLVRIEEKCAGKQIIIATHSAYVLNKLGIEKVILLHDCKTFSLANLSVETQSYFKKLSGYDTLRLILAKKAILVEGPSDELIVQKSYRSKHAKLPIQDGIDVINVRGLSFARFLEIATELNKEVVVVTDNDGNYEQNVETKYLEYSGNANIKICASKDNSAKTLESQIVRCNELSLLNRVLGKKCKDGASLADYMVKNKTECALKIFESAESIKIPAYIENAVS
jgi:putative ATP-dependent endonuclease of the OLD family